MAMVREFGIASTPDFTFHCDQIPDQYRQDERACNNAAAQYQNPVVAPCDLSICGGVRSS